MFKRELENMSLPHIELSGADPSKKEIYLRFMGHIRHVPVSRPEIKILSAIQYTADAIYSSDAHVAKELVEMGLRAPRLAFPTEFLDYIDRALMRCGWDIGAPSQAMEELRDLWYEHNDQMNLPFFRHVHSIITEDVMS